MKKHKKSFLSSPNTADIGCQPQKIELLYWDVIQQYSITGIFNGTGYQGTGYDRNGAFVAFSWNPGEYLLSYSVSLADFPFKQISALRSCVPIYFSGKNGAGGPATITLSAIL